MWHLEQTTPTPQLRPIAVQWGGQTFAGDAKGCYNFALASNLSNICRLLDVEYEDPAFVASLYLNDIAGVLR